MIDVVGGNPRDEIGIREPAPGTARQIAPPETGNRFAELPMHRLEEREIPTPRALV